MKPQMFGLTSLTVLGETDPVVKLPQVAIANGVPIFGCFHSVDVLQWLPASSLVGLRLILTPTSPIEVPERMTGWYHKLFQVAWVKVGDRDEWEVARSILHESGHHIWRSLKQPERRHFSDRTRKLRGGPNDWNDPEERFADAVALTILGYPHSPKITKVLTEVFPHAVNR